MSSPKPLTAEEREALKRAMHDTACNRFLTWKDEERVVRALPALLAAADRVEELEAWIRLSAANWEILRVGGFRLDQARGVASSMIASLSDDPRQSLSEEPGEGGAE